MTLKEKMESLKRVGQQVVSGAEKAGHYAVVTGQAVNREYKKAEPHIHTIDRVVFGVDHSKQSTQRRRAAPDLPSPMLPIAMSAVRKKKRADSLRDFDIS